LLADDNESHMLMLKTVGSWIMFVLFLNKTFPWGKCACITTKTEKWHTVLGVSRVIDRFLVAFLSFIALNIIHISSSEHKKIWKLQKILAFPSYNFLPISSKIFWEEKTLWQF